MSNTKGIGTARKKRIFLEQLHFYTILSLQTIASALLIAIVIWPLFRIPDPEVRVTSFVVDGIGSKKPDRTSLLFRSLIHCSLSLRNPDFYKSIHYDVLVLRVTYSSYDPMFGLTLNYDTDGKGVNQRPRDTNHLPEQTIDYSYNLWDDTDLGNLTIGKAHINVKFMMEFKVMVFNRVVICTRQRSVTATIYFNTSGDAFIYPSKGLLLNY